MELEKIFGELPRRWDGRESILEMQRHDYQWRQMEWIGFFFQHIVKRRTSGTGFSMPGRRFVSGDFDAQYKNADWDLKTHSVVDSQGRLQTVSILNDAATIDLALSERRVVYVAVAEGVPIFDTHGAFQVWHENLKGSPSPYVLEGLATGRNSRVRKAAFELNCVKIYEIDSAAKLGTMRQGKNSNGRPRPLKYTLDSRNLSPIEIFSAKSD